MSGTAGTTAEMEAQQEGSIRSTSATVAVVICLGPWYQDASTEHLQPLLAVLQDALGDLAGQAMVAYPVSDSMAAGWLQDRLLLQPYMPSSGSQGWLVQTAGSYLDLYEVMRAHASTCGLLLGAEAHTLHSAAIRALIDTVWTNRADLAMARYQTGDNEALINASTLYPVSRSLFAVDAAFPLALDLALSNRMAERMAAAAQRFTTASQPEAILWAASEAAVAGYTVAEVQAGQRVLPHPAGLDISSILNDTAASLFSDVEAKAAFWQRVRPPTQVLTVPAVAMIPTASEPVDTGEVAELISSFRIGYGNLHEIWSLVLPPQTLLGLKRLSTTPNESFSLSDALWVRIVYDFVLAHRLRTINRSHLLGSLTPLYLAWVASHLLNSQPNATERLARAFEADKPYLVSRWRWPDRFNP